MCSYCGCREITEIGRLSEEHEELVNLLGELRRAIEDRDIKGVQRCAVALHRTLRPHTLAEEQGLFAELRHEAELEQHIDELLLDHTEIEEALEHISAGDHSAYALLEHELRRHIDREENGLFPAAAVALGGDAWDRIELVRAAVDPRYK